MITCETCENPVPVYYTNADGERCRTFWKRTRCFDCQPLGRRPPRAKKKRCLGCPRTLPMAAFARVRGNGRVTHEGRCPECLAAFARAKRTETKRLCVEYLGGSCVDCGYNRCLAALDFHHLEPKHKDFEIGRRKLSNIETLKPELDKCVLVCRNCHAERHFNSSR